MIQITTDTTVLLAAFALAGGAVGAVGKLASWGIESLKSRSSTPPTPPPRRNAGDGGRQIVQMPAECDLLLKQTHAVTASTDRKVDKLGVVLDERLGALLEVGKSNVEATQQLGEKIIALAHDRDT